MTAAAHSTTSSAHSAETSTTTSSAESGQASTTAASTPRDQYAADSSRQLHDPPQHRRVRHERLLVAGAEPRAEGFRLHDDGTVARVLRTEFDVGAYTRSAHERVEVDAHALREAPGGLEDPQMRRDLGFLQRIDAAALSDVRAMYSTWTVTEARITAFVATWLYERHWTARAERDLLEATGPIPRADGRAAPLRRRIGARVRSTYAERALPIVAPLWTATLGEAVTAAHMTRMAIMEASLVAARRALLSRLSGEAQRVMQELIDRSDRIVDFFQQEAIARVTRSRAEAVAARVWLSATGPAWRVAGVADPVEDAALISIFRTPEARAELRRAHQEITRLLPGPALARPGAPIARAGPPIAQPGALIAPPGPPTSQPTALPGDFVGLRS